VRALAEELKTNGGVIPGVLTLGTLGIEKYVIDGQHRLEAFKISLLPEVYADIRVCQFDSMGEMGNKFVELNSCLVRLKPDDILRGLEGVHDGLTLLRKRCPFIGYDYIRRNDSSPILSAALSLRGWFKSQPEIPGSSGNSSIIELTDLLTPDEAEKIAVFFNLCYQAWGRDAEYSRLWGVLSLTVTAWLYRRTVLTQYSPRTLKVTREQFVKCLMAVSASSKYIDWLGGRVLGDRDRSPCYGRLKALVSRRLTQETPGKKYLMPAPAWSHGISDGRLDL